MRLARPGSPMTLSAFLDDEGSGLFLTALVLDEGGSIAATLNLDESGTASGYHEGRLTLSGEGDYFVKYKAWTDAARTVPAPLHRIAEDTIRVTSLESDAAVMRGEPIAEF